MMEKLTHAASNRLISSGLYRIIANYADTVFTVRNEIDTPGNPGGTRFVILADRLANIMNGADFTSVVGRSKSYHLRWTRISTYAETNRTCTV